MIIDIKKIDEIEEKKEGIAKSHLEKFVKQMFDSMKQDCILQASTQDSDNAARKDEVLKNYYEAWNHGIESYDGQFNLIFLTDFAGRIEPCLKMNGAKFARFRNGTYTVGDYAPPADETRVRNHLERLLTIIDTCNLHPVEEAFLLYHHIIRIQPFENGNKRTASGIMNITLLHNNFPPVCVLPNKREMFRHMLYNAVQGFREDGSQTDDGLYPYIFPGNGQKALYNFLANSLIEQLDTAKSVIDMSHEYIIHMETRDPGVMYRTKKIIACYLNKNDVAHQETLNVKEKTLRIVGFMYQTRLEKILGSVNGLKYDIETIR